MTYLPPITELHVLGVFDAGVPNRERIVLRPSETTDLSNFAIVLGKLAGDQQLIPYDDSFYWFGGRVVTPPSWISVFTGVGADHEETLANGEKALVLFWNRRVTVFSPVNADVVPGLVKFGAFAGIRVHPVATATINSPQ